MSTAKEARMVSPDDVRKFFSDNSMTEVAEVIINIDHLLRKYPNCDKYGTGSIITCGWKRLVEDIRFEMNKVTL